MSLSIKNREAYQLASELAKLTGKSMTAIVVEALRKEREQVVHELRKERLVNDLMAIGRRCAAHIQQPVPAVEHGILLFDERGLPR